MADLQTTVLGQALRGYKSERPIDPHRALQAAVYLQTRYGDASSGAWEPLFLSERILRPPKAAMPKARLGKTLDVSADQVTRFEAELVQWIGDMAQDIAPPTVPELSSGDTRFGNRLFYELMRHSVYFYKRDRLEPRMGEIIAALDAQLAATAQAWRANAQTAQYRQVTEVSIAVKRAIVDGHWRESPEPLSLSQIAQKHGASPHGVTIHKSKLIEALVQIVDDTDCAIREKLAAQDRFVRWPQTER